MQNIFLKKNIEKNMYCLYRNIDGLVKNLTKDFSFIMSNVTDSGNLRSKSPTNIIFWI